MTVSLLFFIIATVICLGFAGKWIFKVTRIPDSLLLIAAGFGLRSLTGLELKIVETVAPYFGAFALLVILFEGGLHLDFEHMLRSWRQALKLLGLSFLLSFGLVILTSVFFGRSALNGALLASAIACTSAAIIIPLIREIKVDPQVRTVLELESSLSDALAVLITVTILGLVSSKGEMVDDIGPWIFTSLTGALVVGIGAGLAWMWVLKKLAGQPLCYLMTFAGMLIVYALSETLHSSGVLGVFIFGLTMSNGPTVLHRLFPHFYRDAPNDREVGGSGIGMFHAELTFLVRTFFFVFLGMLFDVRSITLIILLESMVIYLAVLAARLVAVNLTQPKSIGLEGGRAPRILFLFMPRGLASAVLATLPAAYGLLGTEQFVPLTVLIILYTNLAITIGVRWVEKAE